jgi:hypothetical protein
VTRPAGKFSFKKRKDALDALGGMSEPAHVNAAASQQTAAPVRVNPRIRRSNFMQ